MYTAEQLVIVLYSTLRLCNRFLHEILYALILLIPIWQKIAFFFATCVYVCDLAYSAICIFIGEFDEMFISSGLPYASLGRRIRRSIMPFLF